MTSAHWPDKPMWAATYAATFAHGREETDCTITNEHAFDPVKPNTGDATQFIANKAIKKLANLRYRLKNYLGVLLDKTTCFSDIELRWSSFAKASQTLPVIGTFGKGLTPMIPPALQRDTLFLTHSVFSTHHSETAMLRDIRCLRDKNLAPDRMWWWWPTWCRFCQATPPPACTQKLARFQPLRSATQPSSPSAGCTAARWALEA